MVEASTEILALLSLMDFVCCSLVFSCLSGGSINVFTATELRRLFLSLSSSLGGLSNSFFLAAGFTILGGSFRAGECKGAGATAGGAVKGFGLSWMGTDFAADSCCLGGGKSGKLELELSECVITGEGCSDGFAIVFMESLGRAVTPSIVAAGKLSVSLKSKFNFLSTALLAGCVVLMLGSAVVVAGGFIVAFARVAETLEEEEEVDKEEEAVCVALLLLLSLGCFALDSPASRSFDLCLCFSSLEEDLSLDFFSLFLEDLVEDDEEAEEVTAGVV